MSFAIAPKGVAMNYYKHNIGDFAIATASLDLEEVGIFVRLVDHQILHEKPIKTQWVSFAFKKDVLDKVNRVLGGLFEETADGWVYPPAVEWITEYQNNAEKNRDNGKKGGRPRKSTQKEAVEEPTGLTEKPTGFSEKPTGNRLETQKKPNHKPLTINQEKEKEIDKEKVADAPVDADASPDSVADAPSLDSKKETAQAKPHRLDIETLPYEWFVDCVDLQPDLDAYKLFDEFSDFWANEEGKKAMKRDWRRAWKNHLRNLPSWKHENYERKGRYMWDGKPWRRPVDPNSNLARSYADEEYAKTAHLLEDQLMATAERMYAQMNKI